MTNDLTAQVVHFLDAEVRPALRTDGVEIELVEVRDDVVRVRLRGSCTSCPSAILAVIMEIEQQLRNRIPEVERLEAVP